jgi:tRNA A-37 threonylcarbamoyl transferase component Bud32
MSKDRPANAPTVPASQSDLDNVASEKTPLTSRRSVSGLKVVTVSPGQVSIPDTESGLTAREVLQAAADDPYLGATIDNRYKIEAILGEGGMGVVYRCRHTIIDKKVAMKVLRADLARDREVTERFLNEAKAASAIGNPHIIDISDFGQLPDGSTYFVMEHLDGSPLSDLVGDGGPVGVPRILYIARQLSEGLAAAHNANIVHRDLKPDNIFLINRGTEKDFVKILDFGIAKVSTGEGKLTRAGAVFGTPHYMSPEQAAGAPIDHRCDIYSLGVILYELASGKVPFDADNFMGILTQHMYKAPVPIRALVPQPQDVPPGLEAIVLKCLSKRPEQRYQSMEELIDDLDRTLQGTIPAAVTEMMERSAGFNVPADYFQKAAMPAPVPATPGGGPVPKNRWPLFAGLAGVMAAVGIVVAIFARSMLSTAAPPTQTVAPRPSIPDAAPAPPASEAIPVPTKQILLAVEPNDAEVFDEEKSLGRSPVALDVPEGETLKLSITRDGYKQKELEVDGTKEKLFVELEKEQVTPRPVPRPRYRPAARPTPRPKPKPRPIGGGEIVNPWD